MNQQILQETEDLDEFMMVLANNSPSSGPLYIACVLGNFTIADLLIQSGTDVNSVPISIIYLQGLFKLETITWLLENGSSMYHKNKGLNMAINGKNYELIKVLIEYGANVNIDNGLPLKHMSWDGNIEIVDLLLKAGADVHVDNDIPLRNAFSCGHVKVVELLLNFGANIHIFVDEDLRSAFSCGHVKVVELLLNFGANSDE
jgi:ankyrin repeat protein